MDKFPKFIILDDKLILTKVKYHKDILLDQVDPINERHRIKGGGWYRFKSETNTFTFYGDSNDFGAATLEDIQKAVTESKVFSDVYERRNLSENHNFAYDTGSEEIQLKTI